VEDPLARVTVGLLVVGTLVTLGFMIRAGEPGEWWWWPLFLPFATWSLAPYAAVAHVLRRRTSGLASRGAVCLAAALLAGTTAYVLYSAFVVHLDPQSGLVFLFLPLWQLLGVAPILWVAQWLARREAAA
jgi:hypothetical protein